MESQSESETQCQTENDNILLASLLSTSKSQENLSQDTLASVNQDVSSSKVRSTKRASAANVSAFIYLPFILIFHINHINHIFYIH